MIRLRGGEQIREVRIERGAALLDGRRVELEARPVGGGLLQVRVDGRSEPCAAARRGDRIFVWCGGRTFVFERPRRAAGAPGAGEHAGDLLAPMPGRIRKILVQEGDAVTRGQVLLVLEAMKMEHAIRAPKDGRVRLVRFRDGDLVEAGAEMLEIAEGP